jgi:hypothetical protein
VNRFFAQKLLAAPGAISAMRVTLSARKKGRYGLLASLLLLLLLLVSVNGTDSGFGGAGSCKSQQRRRVILGWLPTTRTGD